MAVLVRDCRVLVSEMRLSNSFLIASMNWSRSGARSASAVSIIKEDRRARKTAWPHGHNPTSSGWGLGWGVGLGGGCNEGL